MVFRRRALRRSRRQPPHHSYSRWDGSQTGFAVDADHLFDELADDLLYHGDVNNALRQMMQGEATPAQLGSFLTALRLKGESTEEIAGTTRNT